MVIPRSIFVLAGGIRDKTVRRANTALRGMTHWVRSFSHVMDSLPDYTSIRTQIGFHSHQHWDRWSTFLKSRKASA